MTIVVFLGEPQRAIVIRAVEIGEDRYLIAAMTREHGPQPSQLSGQWCIVRC